MSLTSYQTAPFRYNKCYTLPVHQDCVAIDPRHCVFRRKDKRSLQPQTYFVQYKDIKTADSHTLYTPTISSGVPVLPRAKYTLHSSIVLDFRAVGSTYLESLRITVAHQLRTYWKYNCIKDTCCFPHF